MSLVAVSFCTFFFFNDTATTEIYTISLHDALPICARRLHHDPRTAHGGHAPSARRGRARPRQVRRPDHQLRPGGIVDERALADAIRAGPVAGAALDVFEQDPPPPTHPLLGLDQQIVT